MPKHTLDTSQAEGVNADEPGAETIASRGGVPFALLLDKPPAPRSLLDVDDPLEGCDATVRAITYGRVGDPAGTHTRARCKAVTVRAFGYEPTWPREWMGSSEYEREDGDEIGEEISGG